MLSCKSYVRASCWQDPKPSGRISWITGRNLGAVYGIVLTTRPSGVFLIDLYVRGVRLTDPYDLDVDWMNEDELQTAQNLVDGLAELRLLAIRLDLKVVGAIVSSAIGMVPLTKH